MLNERDDRWGAGIPLDHDPVKERCHKLITPSEEEGKFTRARHLVLTS